MFERKFEDTTEKQQLTSRSDEIAIDVLVNIREDKLRKACDVLNNYADIDLTFDEIITALKEKEIEKKIKDG